MECHVFPSWLAALGVGIDGYKFHMSKTRAWLLCDGAVATPLSYVCQVPQVPLKNTSSQRVLWKSIVGCVRDFSLAHSASMGMRCDLAPSANRAKCSQPTHRHASEDQQMTPNKKEAHAN